MKNLLFTFSIIFLLSSCATIFTGTKDRISFNTNPEGATLYIDGIEQCTTPCVIKVKRDINDTDVEFKLDGYETRLISLSKDFNVVSVLNLGNLLGWGVDALSGAIYKYDRRSYDIQLDSEGSSRINPAQLKPIRIDINTIDKTIKLYVSNE